MCRVIEPNDVRAVSESSSNREAPIRPLAPRPARPPARARFEDRVGRSEKRSPRLEHPETRALSRAPRAPPPHAGPETQAGTGDLRGLSCLRAPARDAPEARTAVRECSRARLEKKHGGKRKEKTRTRAFFGFRLTPTRAAVIDSYKVFTHGVSCAFIRKPENHVRRLFRAAARRFHRRFQRRDGFKDVYGQTPPIKHRSSGRVCIFRFWKESRARFALDAFVKRARFYTRVDVRRVAS